VSRAHSQTPLAIVRSTPSDLPQPAEFSGYTPYSTTTPRAVLEYAAGRLRKHANLVTYTLGERWYSAEIDAEQLAIDAQRLAIDPERLAIDA
jgi:hypothetical protein